MITIVAMLFRHIVVASCGPHAWPLAEGLPGGECRMSRLRLPARNTDRATRAAVAAAAAAAVEGTSGQTELLRDALKTLGACIWMRSEPLEAARGLASKMKERTPATIEPPLAKLTAQSECSPARSIVQRGAASLSFSSPGGLDVMQDDGQRFVLNRRRGSGLASSRADDDGATEEIIT